MTSTVEESPMQVEEEGTYQCQLGNLYVPEEAKKLTTEERSTLNDIFGMSPQPKVDPEQLYKNALMVMDDKKHKEDKEEEVSLPTEITSLRGTSACTDPRFIIKDGVMIPFYQSKLPFLFKYESEHDKPCPGNLGDVSADHEVQENLFNRLPLKEDQKKQLLNELAKEKRQEERIEKSESDQLVLKDTLKQERHNKRKLEKSNIRKSVKAH